MITIELTKEDLVCLVMGVSPNYSIFPEIRSLGEYSGSYDTWGWNNYRLNEKTEGELWNIYQLCKNSWK